MELTFDWAKDAARIWNVAAATKLGSGRTFQQKLPFVCMCKLFQQGTHYLLFFFTYSVIHKSMLFQFSASVTIAKIWHAEKWKTEKRRRLYLVEAAAVDLLRNPARRNGCRLATPPRQGLHKRHHVSPAAAQ